MTDAFLSAIEYYLPKKILSNDELATLYPEWTPEKILNKTGIVERRVVCDDETSLDLALRAAEELFSSGVVRKEEVDFLLFVTETPDYLLPSSACVLHGKLGLPDTCGAFDINLGCSGYVYGLAVAKSLIVSGLAHRVLLLTADTYSKLINPMDKSTRTLFGDAGTASLVSDEGEIRIGEIDLGSRGSGFDRLIVPAGMFRNPSTAETSVVTVDENGYSRSQENVFMSGSDIMAFSIEVVPKTVKRVLEKSGVEQSAVSRFFFHQANAFMLGYLQKKLKIADDRFEMSFSDIGNTVSSSVPIAIKRSMERGDFPKEGLALLCGFGVGLSWGSALLEIGGK